MASSDGVRGGASKGSGGTERRNLTQQERFLKDLNDFLTLRQELQDIWNTVSGNESLLEGPRGKFAMDKMDEGNKKLTQRNADGINAATSLKEVFEAAEVARPVLANVLAEVSSRAEGVEARDPEQLSRERARNKASQDFTDREGLPEGWLYDVLRGELVCDDVDGVVAALSLLRGHQDITPLKIENRFDEPRPDGVRCFEVTMRLKRARGSVKKVIVCKSAHICRVDIHLRVIITQFDKRRTPTTVAFGETYLTGIRLAVKERLGLLQQVHKDGLDKVMEYVSLTESKIFLMGMDKLLEMMGAQEHRQKVLQRQVEIARKKFTDEMKLKETTSQHGKHGETAARYAAQLNSLATLLHSMGQTEEARSMFEESLQLDEKVYGRSDPEIAVDLNNLADLLLDMGLMTEARPLYERCINILEKSLGHNHPHLAVNLSNLARVLSELGEAEHACPLYKRSLEIREKAYGEEHPRVVRSVNNYALSLENLGRLDEALPLRKRVIAICERVLGKDHPSVAQGLNMLGRLYKDMGRNSDSEKIHRRALDTRERVFGADSTEVGESLNNLAGVLADRGRLDEATKLIERSISIFRAIQNTPSDSGAESSEQGGAGGGGPAEERTDSGAQRAAAAAPSLTNLGFVQEAKGNLKGAREAHAECVELRRKSVAAVGAAAGSRNDGKVELATALVNLAKVELQTGEHSDAKAHLEEALAIYQARGEHCTASADVLARLHKVHAVLQEDDEADRCIQEAIRSLRATIGFGNVDACPSLETLGEILIGDLPKRPITDAEAKVRAGVLGGSHPSISAALFKLSQVLRDMNRFYEADLFMTAAHGLRLKRMGPRHPETVRACAELGEIKRLRAKHGEALPLMKKVLTEKQAVYGEIHPEVAKSYVALAGLARAMGQVSQATSLYEKALLIFEEAYGKGHHSVAGVCNKLAALSESVGNYKSAMTLRQRVINIGETSLGADHPDMATWLDALAALSWRMGKLEEAKPLYERSLTIREKFDPDGYTKGLRKVAELTRAMEER